MSLASQPVAAQTKINLPVACEQPELVSGVLEKYQEKLLFVGLDNHHNTENLTMSVFFNKETRTYSVFFTVPGKKLICIVSSGNLGELVDKR